MPIARVCVKVLQNGTFLRQHDGGPLGGKDRFASFTHGVSVGMGEENPVRLPPMSPESHPLASRWPLEHPLIRLQGDGTFTLCLPYSVDFSGCLKEITPSCGRREFGLLMQGEIALAEHDRGLLQLGDGLAIEFHRYNDYEPDAVHVREL